MNDTQIDRLKMYNDTVAYLKVTENAAIIAGNTYIAAAITNIENAVERINLLSMVQNTDHRGLTSAKNLIESDLVGNCTKVIDGLVAFATATDNHDLLSIVDYKKSEFGRARDAQLIDIVGILLEKANLYKHELEGFDVKDTDITAVTNKKDQYVIALPAKRITDADRKAATSQLETEFQSTSLYMRKKLDNLLIQYRTSHPDFYQGYLNIRIIVNRGHRAAAPSTTAKKSTIGGIVKHFETGLPLANVTVKLLPVNLVVVTGADGLFSFIVEQVGTYQPVAELPQFTSPEQEPFDVILGQTYYIEIFLEPIETP
jgi:hypothetical protein